MTKMAKIETLLPTKTAENRTLWGAHTHTAYGLHSTALRYLAKNTNFSLMNGMQIVSL